VGKVDGSGDKEEKMGVCLELGIGFCVRF